MLLWLAGLLFFSPSARHRRSTPVRALLKILIGCGFMLAAMVVVYFSFGELREPAFSIVSIATFLAALCAEFLIGEDLRTIYRGFLNRRSSARR
jgi:hypothetical protein